MCVIVDINIAHRVLLKDNDPDFSQVNAALRSGKIILIYGGQLATEYNRNNAVRKIVVSLERAGRAYLVGEPLIEAELTWIRTKQSCESNDQHIIALARAGGARILCSNDRALGRDFTNRGLVNRPRGKIYKSTEHRNLLKIPCRRQHQ